MNDNNMRYYRIKKGLKQEEIAKMINCTKAGYSLYESGQRQPKASIIIKLADILDCSINDLINHFANLES